MKQHEVDKIVSVIKSLMDDPVPPAGQKKADAPNSRVSKADQSTEPRAGVSMSDAEANLYAKFKNRLLEELHVDQVFLHLLATRPEIQIDIERRVVELKETELRGRVAKLIAKGFFAEPQKPGAVRSRLEATGTQINASRLSEALGSLVKFGFLERSGGDTYVSVPGFKVTEKTVER